MSPDAPRTHQRRSACRDNCPLNRSGHCEDHRAMLSTSRTYAMVVVGLLGTLLAAVGGTYRSVTTLAREMGPTVAVVAKVASDNARDVQELRKLLRAVEARTPGPGP